MTAARHADRANPAAVRNLLKAQDQACTQFSTHRAAAAQALDTLTGTNPPASLLIPALAQDTCTSNPIATSIQAQAKLAAAADIIKPVTSLAGLYDLGPLS